MQQETQKLPTHDISATKVRQGRSGVQILIVLIVSLALAMAVWFGLEFYGQAIDTQGAQPEAATTDTQGAQPETGATDTAPNP